MPAADSLRHALLTVLSHMKKCMLPPGRQRTATGACQQQGLPATRFGEQQVGPSRLLPVPCPV
eukprot:366278-Chlamydomonas_euryale.AAC.4